MLISLLWGPGEGARETGGGQSRKRCLTSQFLGSGPTTGQKAKLKKYPTWGPRCLLPGRLSYQVDYDSPGVGNRIGYREGDEQKDKGLLHDEWAQPV